MCPFGAYYSIGRLRHLGPKRFRYAISLRDFATLRYFALSTPRDPEHILVSVLHERDRVNL